MRWVNDDGGRAAAGFKGRAGDCVARSIAIASGRPYAEVYARLAHGNATQRASKRQQRKGRKVRTAREGINTTRRWFKDYMAELGATWTPTMQVGQGCKVHLADGELPMGRLVVSVSRHYTAVVDGVIHDTHDPTERGCTIYSVRADEEPRAGWRFLQKHGDTAQYAYEPNRCVYGYWRFT